jgi:WD40 repeat protein
MSEVLIPIPKTSLEKFLRPVNRITESCVLRSDKNSIYTLCCSNDNSIILYANASIPIELQNVKLNIINIKKLLTGLDCLGDDGEFKLIYKQNHLLCKSSNSESGENTHFKYHLCDDNIIKESAINISKIADLNFDTTFEIPIQKLKQIMSAYSYTDDVNKIYFYSKDKKIYAEINDYTQQNTDNVSLLVSSEYNGIDITDPISIKIEIFKLLSTSKMPIKVKINNDFKVFVFETQEDQYTQLKYIISALVK